jgi:PAS domain S-box-containing protein
MSIGVAHSPIDDERLPSKNGVDRCARCDSILADRMGAVNERMESRPRATANSKFRHSKARDRRRLSTERTVDTALATESMLSAPNRSIERRGANVTVCAEALYDVADIVPVPIVVVDLNGFLKYGNGAWAAATGSSDSVHQSAIWTDACHPDDRARAVQAFRTAVATRESFEIDVRLQMAGGTYRWWSLAAVPHHDSHRRVTSYVGACTDASAKYQAEQVARRLTSRLVAAQESERSRIARELHDDLGQRLALLAAALMAAERKRRADFKDVHRQLREITAAAHALSHRLHPGKLKLIGLVKTLQSLSQDVSSEFGLKVAFDADGMLLDVTGDTALCLFRVAQEALQNAVKHSGAHSIRVHIARDGMQVRLHVTDDGRGFQLRAEQSEGLGLLTMRERVELMRGTLKIRTAHDRGTTIEAVIPASDKPAPQLRVAPAQ